MMLQLARILSFKDFLNLRFLILMSYTAFKWVRSLGWEDPWRRTWQPTPVFCLENLHGQRSLAGYCPWGHKELDMTEWLSTAQPLKACSLKLKSSSSALLTILICSVFLLFKSILIWELADFTWISLKGESLERSTTANYPHGREGELGLR